jgi:hypothetical protein
MADPYIDPFETLIYGKFAREQMKDVCLGKVAKLDGMVAFAIAEQKKADESMQEALERQPKPAPPLDAASVLDEARDVVVRFGSHLDSLKGRPVDPKLFFRGEAPSVLARRRLTKLAGSLRHILATAKAHEAVIRDAAAWIDEIREASKKLDALEKQQRAARVERVDLGPELGAAREAWLGVYNANKSLIRGLLAHAGKPELMPLVFDDLAEVHRAGGVSDALPEEAAPEAKLDASAPKNELEPA